MELAMEHQSGNWDQNHDPEFGHLLPSVGGFATKQLCGLYLIDCTVVW